MRRLKKRIFLELCGGFVAVMGVVRWTFPQVAVDATAERMADVEETTCSADSVETVIPETDAAPDSAAEAMDSGPEAASCPRRPHPIRSVHSYAESFPDLQDVQMQAAKQWGVKPVRDRAEAEQMKNDLVYVGATPYYCLDRGMTHSIPYLVPRASQLLSDIGRNYLDSLYVKGIPLHRIIVSSVLRTEHDVTRLRRGNGNASEQSCHRFATTFDICYNRFSTVSPPDGPARRAVQNDTLKWVLSEVLRDIRNEGRCYIKYEVKQGCFHITVR